MMLPTIGCLVALQSSLNLTLKLDYVGDRVRNFLNSGGWRVDELPLKIADEVSDIVEKEENALAPLVLLLIV